jgi:hypothetical protein
MTLDGGEQISKGNTGAPGLDHQPLGLVFQGCAPRGWTRRTWLVDHGRDSRPDDQQPFLGQRRHDLVRGVGIDLELHAQRTDGGEGISRAELSRDDGSPDRADDLLVVGVPA